MGADDGGTSGTHMRRDLGTWDMGIRDAGACGGTGPQLTQHRFLRVGQRPCAASEARTQSPDCVWHVKEEESKIKRKTNMQYIQALLAACNLFGTY